MGPQHPSTHGVLRVILKLDGEKVLGTECVIGYLHRGVEKIAENRTYAQFAPYVDRMDYVAAVSNGLGYCLAVEKLLNVEAPPRAQVVRVILTELNRIASHLIWLGTHALDIGAITPLFYCHARARRGAQDLREVLRRAPHHARLPHRRPAVRDSTRASSRKCKAFCDMFLPKVDEYEELLTGNRIWIGRLKNVGVLNARGLQGVRRHRTDAARRRREVGPAQGAAVLRLREVRFRDSDPRRTATPTTGTWCACRRCGSRCRIMRQAVDGIPERAHHGQGAAR